MNFIEFIDAKDQKIAIRLSTIALFMTRPKDSHLLIYQDHDPGSQLEIDFAFPLRLDENYSRLLEAIK